MPPLLATDPAASVSAGRERWEGAALRRDAGLPSQGCCVALPAQAGVISGEAALPAFRLCWLGSHPPAMASALVLRAFCETGEAGRERGRVEQGRGGGWSERQMDMFCFACGEHAAWLHAQACIFQAFIRSLQATLRWGRSGAALYLL